MSSIGVAFLASNVAYPDSSNCFIRRDSINAFAGRASRLLALKTGNGVGETEMGMAHQLRCGGLAEDGFSYKERFVVRFHEVGCNRIVTVQTIANYFQEVGCNHFLSTGHSTKDGFSTTPTMRKFGLIWVMSRMHIDIYKYPAWNDVVEIETWCQCEGNINTRRDWIIHDCSTGQVIGRATSNWLLLNQETRRLQKVPDAVLQEILRHSPKQPRLAFPEVNSSSINKIEKLDEPAQYSRLGLKPRRVDLDMNQHVNNVTYIGWLLESVPSDIHSSHELQSLTLEYKRECRHNDMIDSLVTQEGEVAANNQCSDFEHGGTTNDSNPCPKEGGNGLLQFRHLLRLSGKGLETNRGRSKWREKKPLK